MKRGTIVSSLQQDEEHLPQKVLIGFDGFIDTLALCIDKRSSPRSFKRLSTIPAFSKKILSAASKSINIECLVKENDIGGNAPLLARALCCLGHPATLIGTCGYPSLHPLFQPLKNMGLNIHSFADPGYTDALEFTDGKVLLGKMGELSSITLRDMTTRLKPTLLPSLVRDATCIVTANWTMMPLVGEFWEYLLLNSHLLELSPKKTLFVDLADPAKRPVRDLKRDLRRLTDLNSFCSVVLGLNTSEAEQILSLLNRPGLTSLEEQAKAIIAGLHLTTVVIHTHHQVASATTTDDIITTEALRVPFVKNPVRSTGAGDTFNAGFLAGLLRHWSPSACLQIAVAASGAFVRTGQVQIPETSLSLTLADEVLQ
jgi:sugar/nucleoside kinase (ribokinase family)